MNKQEAIKKTEELEKQLAELKAIIEAPEASELVFKPEIGERYEYIGYLGIIKHSTWDGCEVDLDRFNLGNVFRVGTAKNSAKYYIMNSEYDYWFPWSGQPKPKVAPLGLEVLSVSGKWEVSFAINPSQMKSCHSYRWKRSEQG